MKKLFTWAVLAMTIAMYSSCSKEKDLYVPTATNQDNTQAIADNVKNIFGVTFDAEHDWTMLQQHKVSITADAELNDIAKVAILTSVPSDKGNAYVLNSSKRRSGRGPGRRYPAHSNCPSRSRTCRSPSRPSSGCR